MFLSLLRPLAVWVLTTAVCGAVASWALAAPATEDDAQALVALAAGWALAACAVWCWVVTTVVIAQALRGVAPVRGIPAWARTIVLAACGLALVGGGPALAASTDTGHHTGPTSGGPVVAGLRLPDRTTGPARAHRQEVRAEVTPLSVRSSWAALAAQVGDRTLVVRRGDSLWSISAGLLGPDPSTAEVAALTERLYDLNHDVVGADPDLIRPGLLLRAPHPAPRHH